MAEEDQDLEIATRDFSKLEEAHMNAGFREGVVSGKYESVQRGFNEGFARGVECALQMAVVRGKIRCPNFALQAYCTSRGLASGDKLAALLEEAEGKAEQWEKTVRDGQLEQFRRTVEQSGLKQLIQSDSSNQPTVEGILSNSHLPPPVAELESRLETAKMEIGTV